MANKIKTPEEIIHDAAEKGNIVFGSSDNIDDYEYIARDFLKKIFDLNYDECFISDESALSDFAPCCLQDDDDAKYGVMTMQQLQDEAKIVMVNKIEAEYRIAVDPYDYLVEVFDKIRTKPVSSILQ